jgi:MoaA/NifB/PqqE/SkfB family radical SAM enzyme
MNLNKVKNNTFLAIRYLEKFFTKTPLHVSIEVTKRCNAKCDFCDYHKEKVEEKELDFKTLFKKTRPIVVSLTGGEPTLRNDIIDIIKKIRKFSPPTFISMITNGATLSLEKAKEFKKAGLNALSISLDYFSDRHDKIRKIPGLFNKIKELAPKLKDIGFDVIGFNTIILNDNSEDVKKIINFAKENGLNVNLSAYCDLKNNNQNFVPNEDEIKIIEKLIDYVINFKKINKEKVIKSSNYYLRNIVDYFKGQKIPGCTAGRKWILITPDAKIKRCSEKKAIGTVETYNNKTFNKTKCMDCWFSCRGEAQCPVSIERIKDLI